MKAESAYFSNLKKGAFFGAFLSIYFGLNSIHKKLFSKAYLKVVISKSGLYVREPKNINLSRTRQYMKKSKLGFCRMSSGLSCHVKSLVNTC